MTGLSPAGYLDAIRAELAHIDTALNELTDPSGEGPGWQLRPPACPEWTLGDLVRHLGGVQRMVLQAIGTGKPSRSREHWPEPGTDLAAWLADGGRQLLAALDADPATQAWSFDPEGETIGFWQRRQAMEHGIHRVDVEQAIGGQPTPIDPTLAADGVSEVVDTMLRMRLQQGAVTLSAGSVELFAPDTGDRWLLGTGSVLGSVTAEAVTLWLLLWKRAGVDQVRLDGDTTAVEGFLAARLTQ